MEKFEIRNQVRDAVQTFLEWSTSYDIVINNMLLHLDVTDNNIWTDNTTIYIRKIINGKYELIDTIYLHKYWANNWKLVTDPWVCDLVNDITDIVMKHIEEPKKKEW